MLHQGNGRFHSRCFRAKVSPVRLVVFEESRGRSCCTVLRYNEKPVSFVRFLDMAGSCVAQKCNFFNTYLPAASVPEVIQQHVCFIECFISWG